MQKPGYWDLEMGYSPDDPDMVRGRFAEFDDVLAVIRKYSCTHVNITRVPFTKIDQL